MGYLKRIMKFYIVLSCMILLASTASATLIAVTGLSAATTASLTGTAAILLGAKLLALKGLLIGRALRGRREVETLSEVFLEASKKDQYDCAKMLVCELNSRPEYTLEEDEMIIAKTFGQMEAIDLSLTSVEFDLSALIGRMVGSQRCQTLYSRCTTSPQEIMSAIRKSALKKN